MANNNYKKIFFTFLDESINEFIKEGVWAIPTGIYYKIDNIPFYAYLYSCDDIVEVELINNELIIKKLIEASGNSTVRLLFENKDYLFKIKEELNKLGCESESSENNLLLAVNIPKNIFYISIKNFLDNGETNNIFQYEEACISEYHQKQ